MENGIGVCEIDWEVTTGETRSDFLGKEKREGLKKKNSDTTKTKKQREERWQRMEEEKEVHTGSHACTHL